MIPASLRWIVDRNPFYVLSACCGLAACWLLGDVSRPDLADVATKVAAVFAYEIAVAVLAVWLAKRVATTRDAAILSVLALTLTAELTVGDAARFAPIDPLPEEMRPAAE